MTVFSNTTPIIALSSIQRLDLLRHLFGHIHVVTEVADECEVGGVIAVPALRGLDWLTIVESTPISHPNLLLELDKGEKHTLDMAQKQQQERQHFSRKLKWGPSDFSGEKLAGD